MTDDPRPVDAVEMDRVTIRSAQGHPLLLDVSVRIGRGECFGIIGVSGAGKTILLEAMRGLREASSGSVRVFGSEIARDPAAQRSVAYATQRARLPDWLTPVEVCDHILAARAGGSPPGEATGPPLATSDVLERVGLRRLANTRIGADGDATARMSGGERRRAALALELASPAPVLLLDEPLSGLSAPDSRRILQVIRDERRAARTVVVVAHEVTVEFFDCIDRVLLLGAGGKVRFIGRPEELFAWAEERRTGEAKGLAEHQLEGLPAPLRFWRIYEAMRREQGPRGQDETVASTPSIGGLARVTGQLLTRPAAHLRAGREVVAGAWRRRPSAAETRRQLSALWNWRSVYAGPIGTAGQLGVIFGKQFLREDRSIRRAILAPTVLGAAGAAVLFGKPSSIMALAAFLGFLLGVLPACTAPVLDREFLLHERPCGIGLAPYLLARWIALCWVGAFHAVVLCLAIFAVASLTMFGTPLQSGALAVAFALAVAQAVGAAVGLAVGAVSCTERGALMAAVLVLGIVLAISGMLVPPSGAFNSMVPVFKASPVRWVYGALMAHDHSASLNALGFGRDGYLANLFRAGVMAPIALVFAHRALGRRELT